MYKRQIDESLNQIDLIIRSDGKTTFSLIGQVMCAGKTVEGLQRELNDRYTEFVREPNIVVQVRSGDTPLGDIIDSVDARQGQGGQARATPFLLTARSSFQALVAYQQLV